MMVNTKLIQASLLTQEKSAALSLTAECLLGPKGRRFRNNGNAKKSSARFGATIFDSEAKRIWVGDVEIEKDGKLLISLSEKYGTLYILHETYRGFSRRKVPPERLRHIAAVVVEGGYILYSREFAETVGILDRGRARVAG